jgi:DNA-binding LacI/PurR family transcriptional regulator
MGVVGIEYLLQLVEDPETPIQQHKIMPTLVERQSSAPANKDF